MSKPVCGCSAYNFPHRAGGGKCKIKVEVKSIRSTGREFEESFSCAEQPTVAEQTAQAYFDHLGYRSSPKLWMQNYCTWHVRWFSVD